MFLDKKTKKTIKEVVSEYKLKRQKVLSDLGREENEYKEKVCSLRKKVFNDFEKNLKIAKNNFKENGFIVYEAEDAKKAQEILKKILQDSEGIVKSKTNTAREIGLEKVLKEKNKGRSVETDLGDFIVDLFNSEDMHYVLPALHINSEKISAKIKETWGDKIVADEKKMARYLCGKIRENILQADAGITGANFLTKNGQIILLENEGNISLVSRLPGKHIVICGIDKLTENISDAMELCQAAAIFGTGQKTTQYISVISGPSKTADIQNKLVMGAQGAREVHLILVDNGRRKMIENNFEELLRCINCGACINFCPVYHQIGTGYGGEKYIGSKGVIVSSLIEDLAIAVKKGSFKCTLCGNCYENCPMKINLPELVKKIRTLQSENGLQTNQNKKMIRKMDEFGNPFGEIDNKETPDKLFCC